MKIIGLDIGGTKIEGILWDKKILRQAWIKTPKNRRKFLLAVSGLIRGLMGGRGGKPVKGIGVAMAGAIDQKMGASLRSPNLPYLDNFPIRTYLQKKFRARVALDNDANCFLRAEAAFGQARGKRNVVALTLGTGVGGGLLVEGRIVTGSHGAAAELGHVILVKESKGKFLNLEGLVSRHGFARLGLSDPLLIYQQAVAGNKKAAAIFKKVGQYLGLGLASFVNIFDPELIILGGGISRAARFFLPVALKEMKKYVLLPVDKLPTIKTSKLLHAGALGAVAVAKAETGR